MATPLVIAVTAVVEQALIASGNRLAYSLFNSGANTIFLGKDNTVSPTIGYPLSAGATMGIVDPFDLWVICAAGLTSTLNIEQIFRFP